MVHSRTVPILLCALSLLFSGCVTIPATQPIPPDWAVRSYLVDQIIDTRTAATISFEALVNELSESQVVYVGETHTNLEDHRIQKKIAEALHARAPAIILAMEMFPRESQPLLDRYSRGLLTEEEFLKEVQWQKVWGFPFHLYKPILDWAVENRVPITGLNASQDVVRSISRGGLSALSPKDRARVADEFYLDDTEHRRYVERQYEQHVKGGIQSLETFYEAQLAWEETMAETLAGILAQQGGGARILALIGRGHVNYRFGVPQRTARRVDHSYKIVLPMPIDSPESLANTRMADYVWVTRLPARPGRGRLGVMVRALAGGMGVEVLAVAPESPAGEAGLTRGDVIVMVNGVEVREIEELHEAIAEKRKIHEIVVRRGRQLIEIGVSIPDDRE
jgi:uncharacterized iron-regulated protein